MNDPDLLAELMRLTRFKGGQEQPLVIGPGFMGEVEEGGAFDIAWLVEYHQRLIAIAIPLPDFGTDIANAFLTVPVFKNHFQIGLVVDESVIPFVILHRAIANPFSSGVSAKPE